MSYVYVFLTILLTVYGQLVLKWQVGEAGSFPADPFGKMRFLLQLLLNPWVISGFVASFGAALAWMAAMTKLPLSHAYPFMSLSFVLVLLLSACFFHEPLTWTKAIGMALLVSGVVIGSQG